MLNNCDIGDAGARALAGALHANLPLTTLSITNEASVRKANGRRLGSLGARAFGGMLAVNTRLKKTGFDRECD
jgi:hypothetical protein